MEKLSVLRYIQSKPFQHWDEDSIGHDLKSYSANHNHLKSIQSLLDQLTMNDNQWKNAKDGYWNVEDIRKLGTSVLDDKQFINKKK